MKIDKLIFLDIDGVLNVRSMERDEFGSLYHQHLVDNLKYVIDMTGAKIVISSTWRFEGLKKMQEMWTFRGLPSEVIGITPFRSEEIKKNPENSKLPFNERNERGWEINDWLNDNEVDTWAIVDDDDDFLDYQLINFVKTADNWEHSDHVEGYGLTKICAEKIVDILNCNKT